MYIGTIGTSLEGDLSLVNGTLIAQTVASNVASVSYMDVQKEFLCVSACKSSFQGPVYCTGGLTGGTGAFTSLSVAGVDVKSLTTYQPRNTNLNNFNQLATVQSSNWSGFAPNPKDALDFYQITNGSVVDGVAPVTNAWGVVENTASQYNLTGTSPDMYARFSNVSAGLSLVLKVWVKLGTASNFCLTFMDGPSGVWNSLPGQCFTGLSTSVYTQVSIPVTFTSYQMRLYIGAHSQTGQTQQSPGSVFAYGWQLFQVGSTTTTLETNLVIDGSMRCSSVIDTGTLTCVGLSNAGGYTGQTGSFTSLLVAGVNVGSTLNALSTYPSVQGLTTAGGIACQGVLSVSNTSTLNGAVSCNNALSVAGSTNLATVNFTGMTGGIGSFTQLSCTSLVDTGALSCADLTCSGTGSFNALTVGATNVGSTLTTLTGLRTSGTLSSTSTFQTVFSPWNQRGIFYASSGPPYYSAISAFFEVMSGYSYGSLTLLSQAGNGAGAALNTSSANSGGPMQIFVQSAGGIQVKTTGACTVKWFVMLF
jgi:hypothetical protein